jgi:acetyl esterase/lipase
VRQAAQRVAARALRALPEDWAALLAGATPVIRSRALDPHLALAARATRRQTPLHALTPAEARRTASESVALAAGPGAAPERVEDHRVPGADRRLDGPRPLILYFHQGGFVIGDLDWCGPFCSVLATGARCPVLAVDYRKGPEHRFPAAQEDAWAAYCHVREHADRFGGDPARIGVGGDSAGGGLAAMVAQRAKAEREAPPLFQLLIYPWLLACADNDAYRDFGAVDPLPRENISWFLAHYLGDESERDDLRLSPGLASDLSGLAPALVYTAGFDILCDEGEAYAQRLVAAGVPARYRCFDSLTHAFTSLAGVAPAAGRALEEIARDVDLVLSS